jgi:predicted enzyme related to lactoylglutathione lyase
MKLTQLVMECSEPARLAEFWRTVLDLEQATGDPDWLTLSWEQVGRLSFHRVEGYRPPEWPGESGQQHIHFDLLVDDLQEASQRVEEAGGEPLSEVLNPGPKAWRVYSDPRGTPSVWCQSRSEGVPAPHHDIGICRR